MTQEYEPIKLNESTPAPKEDGIYLLTITFKPETKTLPLFKEGDEYLGADSTYSWGELVWELSTADEATIQSLAAHDAQIRAEAWEQGFNVGAQDCAMHISLGKEAVDLHHNPYKEQQQ